MPDPKSIAFYLRVSTGSQEFDSQLHAIREFCRRQGWPLPNKKTLFAEKVSGAQAKRGELDRLRQACRLGTFDTIVTFRADRLGRSHPAMVNLYAELDSLKIRVVGVADGVDTGTDSPGARLLRNILASVAENTRELIVENTRAGLAAARKKGKTFGRPRKKQKQIEHALRLRKQKPGMQAVEIARRTGLSKAYLSAIFNGRRPAAAPKPTARGSQNGGVKNGVWPIGKRSRFTK